MTLDLSDIGQPRDVTSTCRVFYPKYTGPNPYATNGDGGLTTALGIGKIFAVLGLIISNGTVTIVGTYDPATDKILWWDMAGAQISNGTDLSAYSGHIMVVGQ